MRIAFLTPEFVTHHPNRGGLGNYLSRMSQALARCGHEVEIFVSTYSEPALTTHNGIRVEGVVPHSKRLWIRLISRALTVIGTPLHWREAFYWYSASAALADAMEARHKVKPFDIVQSADCLASGLAVRRQRDRVHVVRCSTAADLCSDQPGSASESFRAKLERAAIRHADKAYAPSEFVAKHYSSRYGLPVRVVRPPAWVEVMPSQYLPAGLPDRYFVHFGEFSPRKGTEWLVQALRRVFEADPSVRMVWIGTGDPDVIDRMAAQLGPHRSKVLILYPLPKADLYAIVKRAEGTVLPTLIDNLPNAVIESLLLGVPVIGTRGVSIDEVVEEGVTGHLVDIGDVSGLAHAIIHVWKGESTVTKGFTWRGAMADSMQPDKAVQAFLTFAAVWKSRAVLAARHKTPAGSVGSVPSRIG